jgi:hypothetical protein
MRYILIQDDDNPEIQMYYVMEDNVSQLIKVVDMNCNECSPPGAHSIIDTNPPLPLCAEQ